ncbi:hypothetical protein ACFX12_032003 [Malus domestica]
MERNLAQELMDFRTCEVEDDRMERGLLFPAIFQAYNAISDQHGEREGQTRKHATQDIIVLLLDLVGLIMNNVYELSKVVIMDQDLELPTVVALAS